MESFTKNDIKILKRVIIDYNDLKNNVDKLIKNGTSYEEIKKYIKDLPTCSFTNEEKEFVDFNYKDMTLSIYNDEVFGLYLGETIEVWDDENCSYIGAFNNTREIGDIIKEIEV